jgi:formate hydrogenlyase transcriptional activator
MNKRIESIPPDALEALVNYEWPGNVRELENLIERALILSPGTELRVPLSEVHRAPAYDRQTCSVLEVAEREYILRALREAGWVIAGPNGAAARLGLKRTSPQYKMQKYGIARPR